MSQYRKGSGVYAGGGGVKSKGTLQNNYTDRAKQCSRNLTSEPTVSSYHTKYPYHALAVFRIQIRRFLDLPDSDPLVRAEVGTDPAPNPSIIIQKE